MSRLYEALKGANRTRKNGSGRESLWDALDLNGTDAAPDTETVRAPSQSEAIPLPGHSTTDSAAATDLEVPVIEIEPHEFGIRTKAGLDQKSRLLPHSVNPMIADYYRRLRTKILQQRDLKPFRSLVVTSAVPQEGKTVTVMNLALSFSSLPDFRVLVVDGDFRRGSVGKWLGVSNEQPGLSNLFCGTARLQDVVLKSDEVPMDFIVSGTEGIRDLHPSHFGGHFQQLSEMYDLVLIDSPPVNLLADAHLLAAHADAVLLVVRAFSTTRKSLEKAMQELAPFRMIGAVLNAGLAQKAYRYYRQY
jgi:capsular exopolysaccharide synthesis family protein